MSSAELERTSLPLFITAKQSIIPAAANIDGAVLPLLSRLDLRGSRKINAWFGPARKDRSAALKKKLVRAVTADAIEGLAEVSIASRAGPSS